MQGLISAITGSPALPFLALSGAVGAVYAFWGKTRPLFSPMAGWGLFAFLATHLIAESWRLSDVLEDQVRIFGGSLFLMAVLYALISRDYVTHKLLFATGAIIPALVFPLDDTALIRSIWLIESLIITQ